MFLKISAPCVSDGSGNPVIANKTKCSVAICFYFTDCFFRASHFIAMTDCNEKLDWKFKKTKTSCS